MSDSRERYLLNNRAIWFSRGLGVYATEDVERKLDGEFRIDVKRSDRSSSMKYDSATPPVWKARFGESEGNLAFNPLYGNDILLELWHPMNTKDYRTAKPGTGDGAVSIKLRDQKLRVDKIGDPMDLGYYLISQCDDKVQLAQEGEDKFLKILQQTVDKTSGKPERSDVTIALTAADFKYSKEIYRQVARHIRPDDLIQDYFKNINYSVDKKNKLPDWIDGKLFQNYSGTTKPDTDELDAIKGEGKNAPFNPEAVLALLATGGNADDFIKDTLYPRWKRSCNNTGQISANRQNMMVSSMTLADLKHVLSGANANKYTQSAKILINARRIQFQIITQEAGKKLKCAVSTMRLVEDIPGFTRLFELLCRLSDSSSDIVPKHPSAPLQHEVPSKCFDVDKLIHGEEAEIKIESYLNGSNRKSPDKGRGDRIVFLVEHDKTSLVTGQKPYRAYCWSKSGLLLSTKYVKKANVTDAKSQYPTALSTQLNEDARTIKNDNTYYKVETGAQPFYLTLKQVQQIIRTDHVVFITGKIEKKGDVVIARAEAHMRNIDEEYLHVPGNVTAGTTELHTADLYGMPFSLALRAVSMRGIVSPFSPP